MSNLRFWLLMILSVVFTSLPSNAQQPVSDARTMPQATCASIPNPANTAAKLITAIEAANDETTCPGADVIDLGSTTFTLENIYNTVDPAIGATALPAISTAITIQNGSLFTGTPEMRFFYITPVGHLSLDALTLIGGDLYTTEKDPVDFSDGGAIYNTGTLSIVDTTLRNNRANNAGAIENTGTVTISDSIIKDNFARTGGAIENRGQMTIHQTIFRYNNVPANFGVAGAIINIGDMTISTGEFIINASGIGGGAIHNAGNLTIDDSQFRGNNTYYYSINSSDPLSLHSPTDGLNPGIGGAIDNNGSLTVQNSLFVDNYARYYSAFGLGFDSDSGGAIYSKGSLTLQNSEIRGNDALFGGGVYLDSAANVDNLIVNSLFSGNETGAVYTTGDTRLVILNSTFAGNGGSTGNYGEPITHPIIHNGTALRVQNSILWNNADGDTISADDQAYVIMRDSIIQGGVPANVDSSHNIINQDPRFVGAIPPTKTPRSDGAYYIRSDSPALDVGDNAAPLDFDPTTPETISDFATDLAGKARIQDGIVDMGAYEGGIPYPPNLVSNGTFTNGMQSWGFYGEGNYTVTNGELRFYRNAGWQGGSVFQQINTSLPSGAKMVTQVQLGNNSNVPKGVEILLRNQDFSERLTCSVTIPPNTPLTTVTMRGVTTSAWSHMVLSLRAYDPDGIAAIRADNVSVQRHIYTPLRGFTCSGLLTPPNKNLMNNGTFSRGLRYWVLYGDYDFALQNGSLAFHRVEDTNNQQAAVLFQSVPYHIKTNSKLRLYVQVGNSSAITRDVEIILRDSSWTESFSCIYTVPPNTPLTYVYVGGTTRREWGNPMVLVRDTTTLNAAHILIDNANLAYLPNESVGRCGNPNFGADETILDSLPDGMKAPTTILPDSGTRPDNGDNAVPAPVAPPNPGSIPEIPGF